MTDIEYLNKYLKKEDLEEGLKKLEQGLPVQYIVGTVDFLDNEIIVNSNVLIPRFETEELVYKTIKYIDKYFNNQIKIIDLGTGSGCIAVALKHNYPSAVVDAVDISNKALEVAKENALHNKCNINFYLGDMLDNITSKYDIIISNPPYIAYDEEIMDIVKNNEPHTALFALNDGLEFYQKIIKSVSKNTNDKSLIAFEIGDSEGERISNLVKEYLPNSIIFLEKDMQGRDRFIFIFNNIEVING